MINKVSKSSENLAHTNLEKLKEVFPQFVKDGEIDFDSLQAFFKEEGVLSGPEKYGLNWSGKSNAFKAIRTPSTGTLVPEKDKSKNWDETENIFIEGDNLEVLKLLQKYYKEKIKMIYIDPPYNTGKDFVYKDNFTQGVSDYYEQTGQTKGGIKMTANTEKNGRYHSDWLTMMYPRLFLGRNLLKDDGVIFVSIDDNEVANLRMMMDEIFGEENFQGHIHWRRRFNQPNDPGKLIALVAEHILVYSKNEAVLKKTGTGKLDITATFKNIDSDPRGEWNSKPWKVGSNQGGSKYMITTPTGKQIDGEWMGDHQTYLTLLRDSRIYFSKDGDGLPRKKIFKNERELDGQVATNWFEHSIFGNNQEASVEVAELFDGSKNIFDNPKPVKLLKNLIRLGNIKNSEIVLDFFSGSGTTAHAVMDLNNDGENRKWICVQLPEITEENTEAYIAGYKDISEISRERIRRAGDKVGKGDTGFKSYRLASSNYRQWNTITGEENTDELLNQSKLFIESPLVDNFILENVVYEIALKEGFDLNVKLKQDTGDLKACVLQDGERRLFVTFSTQVTKEKVEKLKPSADDVFVCFDNSMSDTEKVNIRRIINLKTI